MKRVLSFDDILIVPKFSKIKTRRECSTSVDLNGINLQTPILSANMDTITSSNMANAMNELGGAGVLHRFSDIPSNVAMFNEAPSSIVSIGITGNEKERALALISAGATKFIIDVAHGASLGAAEMYQWLRDTIPEAWICVGNFATLYSYWDFMSSLKENTKAPNALKIGVGSGSMCSTRIVTGCGLPTLASLLDFKQNDGKHPPLIADGGIKNSGDIAKCLAAGASVVMIGSLLSGTDETPGELIEEKIYKDQNKLEVGEIRYNTRKLKKYRGSASKESYEVQDKVDTHRTPEGESTFVPYKGPVSEVVQQLKAGLQSAMSYVGATNLTEFKENSELVEITNNGYIESKPHGKKYDSIN